jgi:hypothetical protein
MFRELSDADAEKIGGVGTYHMNSGFNTVYWDVVQGRRSTHEKFRSGRMLVDNRMKSIAAKTLAGFDNSKPLGRLKHWGPECAHFINGISGCLQPQRVRFWGTWWHCQKVYKTSKCMDWRQATEQRASGFFRLDISMPCPNVERPETRLISLTILLRKTGRWAILSKDNSLLYGASDCQNISNEPGAMKTTPVLA